MLPETIKNFVARLFNGARRGPERLPVEKHGIDRRNVSRHAIKVCEVLHQHGYEAYIVGGAVRDLIVGLQPKDFDVATNATPEQIKPLFRRARIIGRRFRLVHVVFGPEIIETSTFRTASANGTEHTDEHGRILRDNEFGTHEDDAARRDFTLNALYYDPITEEVIDFHRGLSDLQKRIVRMIGDPETRYREDPVRMLRAVRFASKLSATIEPATLQPIRQLAPLIEHVPASRLSDETLKLLTCGHAMDCLRKLRDVGLHQDILPLLDIVFNVPDGEEFVDLALARTDARVRAGKPISPSFLFAALLWKLVYQRWQSLAQGGGHPTQTLLEATDSVLQEQSRKISIQRRYVADIRDIWFMQARFERVNAKAIWRMIEQPRFRAAVDFLQLRAEAREVDSVMAQWWMDLADAAPDDRGPMIEARQGSQRDRAPAIRKRRRRSPRRKPAADVPAS
ncbi:MAG: polynucleotide adenylyltransferase PcnB [Burkholderiaceae bacterium]